METDKLKDDELFTASELQIVADLGIYGCWLIKHSYKIPKEDNGNIEKAYKRFLAAPVTHTKGSRSKNKNKDTLRELIDCIEEFCKLTRWEPPIQDFDEAYGDLIATKPMIPKFFDYDNSKRWPQELCQDFWTLYMDGREIGRAHV